MKYGDECNREKLKDEYYIRSFYNGYLVEKVKLVGKYF